MKKKINLKVKLIGLACAAACAATAFPATAMAADNTVTSAPAGRYQIVRNINIYYVYADGTTKFGGSAPQTGYVSNKYMRFTFPETRVADLFEDGLGPWTPDTEVIPSVTATYDNPPAEVNIYLYEDKEKEVTEEKTITRTINYYKINPETDKKEFLRSYQDSVTFYRMGYIDANGNKVMYDWSGDYTFKAIATPELEAFKADRDEVAAKKVTPMDSDFVEEVIYSKIYENLPPVIRLPEDGWYRILTAKDTNYSLDVNEATAADCANVQIYKKNNSAAQKFYLKSVGDGYYNIFTGTNNKMSSLDVNGNGKACGTNIIQYRNHGGDNQIWKLVINEDGTITFYSKSNGLALDFAGQRCQNFTNVSTWTPNGSMAQKFVIEKL